MGSESPSKRIWTIPNLVSFIRLIGVGVFWWVLLGLENTLLAGWLIFIIGWTDWIDGYLARKLNQESELGRILDPVADRLMIASAVVGGLIANVVPPIIGWGLIAREVLMGIVTLVLISRGAGTLQVRYVGKVATFCLYGAIPAFYLAHGGFLEWFMRPAAWLFGIVGLALYWYAAILYVGDAREQLRGLKSQAEPEEV